jgi:hypothetical protein
VLGSKDVIDKVLELVHLCYDLLLLVINGVGVTSDCLQIGSKEREELLEGCANGTHVHQNRHHVLGLNEDLLSFSEFPSLNSTFSLDLHLSFMVLSLPLVKDSDALVDNCDSLIGLLSENSLDVDLAADFVADLIRDTIEQVFHLVISLVDVAGDRPNKLKPVEKGGQGLFNDWQLTTREVFELPLQSSEEFHEVLGLGMQFLEIGILALEKLHAPAICTAASLILNLLHYLFYIS